MKDTLPKDALKFAGSICSLVSDILEHSKPPSFNECIKDVEALERARRHLSSCRELNSRLLSLARVVASRQLSLEEAVVIPATNYYGMRNIPDELLARIVENLPLRDRARCNLVSRRFHNTLLGTPGLWADIDFSLPEEVIDRLLSMSKGAPLHLILDFKGSDMSTDIMKAQKQKMVLLMKHQKRWRRVTFEESFFSIFQTLEAYTPDFSAVKCMTLPSFMENEEPERDEGEGFIVNPPQRSRFYNFFRWHETSVTRLVLREDIEPDPTLFPALTHLRVVLERPSLFRENELLEFLMGRESLESLSIEIDTTDAEYERLSCKQVNRPAKLPGLKEFRISMQMDCEEENEDIDVEFTLQEAFRKAFCNLGLCFDIPNVESIELGWTQEGGIYDEDKLAPLPSISHLFRSKNMRKLKRFQLTVDPFSRQQMKDDILPFLISLKDRAPNIEEILCRMPVQFIEENTRPANFAPPTLAFLDFVDYFKDFIVSGEVTTLRQKAINAGSPSILDGVQYLLKGISLTLFPI